MNENKKRVYTREEIEELEFKAEAYLYMIHQLAEVQEGYIVDAISLLSKVGKYKFRVKKDIDNLFATSKRLRELVMNENHHEQESVEFFHEESDELAKIVKDFYVLKSLKLKPNE